MDTAFHFIIIYSVIILDLEIRYEHNLNVKIHFKGLDIGSLKMYAINNNDNAETLIFAKYGTQVDDWKQVFIRMKSEDFNYNFSIAVDAISGKPYNGHIGFDDISLLTGPCPELNFVCDFEENDCSKNYIDHINYFYKLFSSLIICLF